jgi:S1-C subfamily serine protease
MEDYGQYMIWADVQIHAGMSGGGLFDSEGYLVGILSGGSDDGQTAAVPYSLILSEFHNSLD